MAIKLSQKGWNNVLIFSCMFMILLFNYTNNMLMTNDEDQVAKPLVAQEQLIQAIDFNGIEIQRLGANWRVLSKFPTVQVEQPEQLIAEWKQRPLQTLSNSPMLMDTVKSMPVVVWIAGQEEGAVYEFFIDDSEKSVYIKDHQNDTWFVHDYGQLHVLIPHQLL